MSSTWIGNRAVEQQEELSFEAQRGLVRTRIIKGKKEDVQAFLVVNNLTASSYQISPDDGDICTATVSLGGADAADPDTPLSIEWTFSANTLELPLERHPKVKGSMEALSDEDAAGVKRWINMMKDGQTPNFTPAAFPLYPDIQKMAEKIGRGNDVFLVHQPTLIQSMRFSPASDLWPTLSAISTVYTNAQLALFGIPTDVASVLPVGEWLGTRIDYQRDSAGYRNTTQEWAYADYWDSWIYPHSTYSATTETEISAYMARALKRFEDWLPHQLPLGPGLKPPVR